MSELPRMNGQPWSLSHIDRLREMHTKDLTNSDMAWRLERTEYAVYCKLKALGLNPDDCNTTPKLTTPTPKKETTMNRTVTVKTFIGNQPASSFNVEAILSAIEKEDKFIARLRKISTSTAVDKLISKHNGNLQALNAVLEGKLTES